MARKMKKFAMGGSDDRYKARYDRKVADIKSDYEKAKQGKTGRAADVAEAKYEQRMADAKDDLAKWTKADRTQTSAAEKTAERNLTMTRRYGAAKPKFDDKPLGEARPSDAELTKLTSDASQKFRDSGNFGSAFKAARAAGDKTFTWRGKSYNTKMAGESGSTSRPAARASSGTSGGNKPVASAAKPPVATDNKKAAVSGSGDKKPASTAPAPRATASYAPTLAEKRAAELRTEAAANRKLAADKKNYSGAAIAARLGERLGFNTSRENTARSLEQQAQRNRWRDVEAEGQRNAEEAAKAQKRAARIAAGNKPNATPTEKFYAANPDAMKKGGVVKKMAKGGKIDGCAVRGKTRARMK